MVLKHKSRSDDTGLRRIGDDVDISSKTRMLAVAGVNEKGNGSTQVLDAQNPLESQVPVCPMKINRAD